MSPSPSTPPRPRESEGPSWWRLGFALLVLKTMAQLSRILFAVTRSSRSEEATSTEARPEKESATPSPEPSSSALQSEVPQGEAVLQQHREYSAAHIGDHDGGKRHFSRQAVRCGADIRVEHEDNIPLHQIVDLFDADKSGVHVGCKVELD